MIKKDRLRTLLKLNKIVSLEKLPKDKLEILIHSDLLEEYKSLYTLPEKWKIKITPESLIPVGKWRDLGPIGKMSSNNSNPSGYCLSLRNGYWTEDDQLEYEEITLEQFKQHILKE